MGVEIKKNCHAEFISASNQLTTPDRSRISTRLRLRLQAHNTRSSYVRFVKFGMTGLIFSCIFTLLFFSFSSVKANAQDKAVNLSDNLKLVRVAINDNSSKSLLYKNVSVIATSDFMLYDKITGKQIAKFSPEDIVKVKISSGAFSINVNNKTVIKDLNTTLVFDCPKGFLGIDNLKKNGKQALYHGIFELKPKNDCQFYLINVLDLENYLKGVVPNEMPTRFGLEALKAQAVAARNYVLLPRDKVSKDFDVDDSVASQVYYGANTESELSNRAVKETSGLVALYDWDLILAQYCSTAGGYTENYENAFSDTRTKEFPSKPKSYLVGKPDIYSVGPLNREEEAKIFYMSYPDSYDMKSPYYRWQREWGGKCDGIKELHDILEKTLVQQSKTGFIKPEFKEGEKLGDIQELRVKQRGVSGKIIELEIVTDGKTYHVYKELVIRRLLKKDGKALPSANVVFENLYDTNKKLNKIVAYGGGYGHGVGMSQFGAGFMAVSLHKSFDKILKRYYTGITISTVPVILSSDEAQKIVTQQFFAPEKKAFVIVDNKYNIKEFFANINGEDVAFELANSIVPIHRVSRIDISSYVRKGQNTITFNFPQEEKNKGIRLYVEVIEKDKSEYNF